MEIDDGARAWMINYARQNYWRVAHWLSLEDLVSDGFLTWYRIVSGEKTAGPRQAGETVSAMVAYQWITDRPHIMSLFKSAYINHITDLANGRTARSPFEFPIEDYMDAPDDATPLIIPAAAPIEIRRVFEVLNTEEGQIEMQKDYPVRANGTRETTNERLQRLTGLSGKITQAIKSYFGESETKKADPKPAKHDAYAAMRREGKSPLEALALSRLDQLNKRIEAERGAGLKTSPNPLRAAIACGRFLIQAKGICVERGISFCQWMAETCAFCATTARKYMWLARRAVGLDSAITTLAAAKRYICSLAIATV